MITSLKIQNLRSIKDSKFIELKPLNILLGANSTGKSTFLRSFPLFTQSVNKKLRGPLSWFDLSLVDFGDFKTAINHHVDPSEGIKFSFRLSFSKAVKYSHRYSYQIDEVDFEEFDDCMVEMTLAGDKEGTYVKQVLIELSSIKLSLHVKNRNDNVSVLINDEEVVLPENMKFNYNTDGSVLPTIEPSKQDESSSSYSDVILHVIISSLQKLCNKRLKNISRLEAILRTRTLDDKVLLQRMKTISCIQSFESHIKQWSTKYGEFRRIYELYVLLKIPYIINVINKDIASYFKHCGYVAPMRAEANRYVRMQGLQVDEVDAYGRNLMEFIASLSKKAKPKFDKFVNDLLGVTVDLPTEDGQKSLHIKKGNDDYSIADVGYGYSQILPIVAKIWHAQYLKSDEVGVKRFGDNAKSTLLIEQPELHLHPALQAKIADCFMKGVLLAEQESYTLSFIVETHSQAIISRVGRRIREGKISPNDVNILLFEKEGETRETTIRQCVFSEKGKLQNWPFGFFDPEDDDF